MKYLEIVLKNMAFQNFCELSNLPERLDCQHMPAVEKDAISTIWIFVQFRNFLSANVPIIHAFILITRCLLQA